MISATRAKRSERGTAPICCPFSMAATVFAFRLSRNSTHLRGERFRAHFLALRLPQRSSLRRRVSPLCEALSAVAAHLLPPRAGARVFEATVQENNDRNRR